MANKKPAGRSRRKAKDDAAAAAPPAPSRFAIVGLGASAGGLEAVEALLRHMPAASGMGFVLVQHLDPNRASVLTEILQRSTAMPVVEAQDGMPVLPDRVHVIPPNRDMAIRHGALALSVPTEPRGQRLPIDAFLRSLAEDQHESAVGIILSGTGSDGALGLRAIAGAGGLCLVQDPKTAKYSGMPQSAIQGGYPIRVLDVEQMPQALRSGTRAIVRGPDETAQLAGGGVEPILRQLRTATGHDFSRYKPSTVGRRIERRMAQHGIDDVAEYARFVGSHPAEAQALFRELLINVTHFFRDPQAFAALKAQALPALLDDKPHDHVLRVWVAGCATGEEAYSIAMLLREWMSENKRELQVQIYSTDLDDEAIASARAGLYPTNIAQDVTPERLSRFFVKDEGGYRVKKEIREMVVFAVQSVIKDPPFTRLDLLACRNLLIYLEPDLQDRLFPAFHYALRPGGVLFLSPSESIGHHTDLFEPIDRKWKLYRARPTAASTRAVLGGGLKWATGASAPEPAPPRSHELQVADLARRALLQAFAPAAVVTNLAGDLLYVHGETGRFLRLAPGQPTHALVEMAREGLQHELRGALREVAESGLPVLNRAAQVLHDGELRPVQLSVRPLPAQDAQQPMLLVSFQELPSAPKPTRRRRASPSTNDARVEALQAELDRAREGMTAMLEEQQASNEELKSTNEELQSTNEELQSTNEELETSKEELQSVNEEMLTVNAELQGKVDQMAQMQDDMKNLLDNIHVGTIFLDRQMRIRSFTKDATRIYRLVAADVGRPLADIRCALQDADLLADAQAVLDSLVPVEREVTDADDLTYLARVQPYRTTENVIDGVVLTFPDVTDRVQAIASAKARDFAEDVVNAVPIPLIVLDADRAVVSTNAAYCDEFGGTPQAVAGETLDALHDGLWNFDAMHELLRGRRSRRKPIEDPRPAHRGQLLHIGMHRIGGAAGDGGPILLSIERADEGGRPPG